MKNKLINYESDPNISLENRNVGSKDAYAHTFEHTYIDIYNEYVCITMHVLVCMSVLLMHLQ